MVYGILPTLERERICKKMDQRYNVIPSAILVDKTKTYLMDSYSNTLFSIEFSNLCIERIVQFDKESGFQRDLYSEMIWGDGCIYFVPHGATTLGIYDATTRQLYSKELPLEICRGRGTFKTAVYINHELYLLGYAEKNVWSYSKEKDKFTKIEIPDSVGLFVAGAEKNNTLFIVSKMSPDIWKIDCKSQYVERCTGCTCEVGYVDVRVINEKVFVISWGTNNVYQYLENRWCLCKKNIKSDFSKWPHHRGLLINNLYYVWSKEENGIMAYDLGTYEEIHIDLNVKKMSNVGLVAWKNKILLWHFGTNEIYELSLDEKIIKENLIFDRHRPVRNINDQTVLNAINESKYFKLIDFIDAKYNVDNC